MSSDLSFEPPHTKSASGAYGFHYAPGTHSPLDRKSLIGCGHRWVAALLLLAFTHAASAGFSIVLQTNSRSVTRVDGQPAKIVEDATHSPAASQGNESSACQAYGRQSAASALANATEVARSQNSVGFKLSTAAVANGGHYRTCGACLAQQCIGIEGHDTGSSAEATASASVLVKFDELTLPGRYRLALAISRSGSADGSSVELRDAAGQPMPIEPDGNYIVRGDPGAIYRVVARSKAESGDRGGCCSNRHDSDMRLDMTVDRLAEIEKTLVPFILGGDFTKGYAQVGLLTLQALDGSVSPHCTATLVGKRTVLTAAHCVADDLKLAISQKRMKFLLGTSIDDPSAERFTIVDAPVPSSAPFVYRLVKSASGDITTMDDVAVAYLDRASIVDPLPVYRGSAPTLQSLIDNTEPIPFVGFGFYSIEADGSAGSGAGKKRQAFVKVDSQDKRTFGYALNAAGQGVCRGDSGGPALVETPPHGWRVLGITAYGATNCTNGRSMKVDAFVTWIDPLIKN
jgi:secreted trypsin-like serine protease